MIADIELAGYQRSFIHYVIYFNIHRRWSIPVNFSTEWGSCDEREGGDVRLIILISENLRELLKRCRFYPGRYKAGETNV